MKDSENEEQTDTEESLSPVAIVANTCPGNTIGNTMPSVIMTNFQADVLASDGYTFPVNAYVDQGATYSAIPLSLAQQHKMKVQGHAILDQGHAGTKRTLAKNPATCVSVDLRQENENPFQIAAFTLKVVASSAPLQAAELSPRIMSKLSTISNILNMPRTEPQEYRIDLILGTDYYFQVMRKRTPLGIGLEAYHTPFRIVLCGPVAGLGIVRQGVHNKEICGKACLLATAIGSDYVDTENPGDAVSLLHSLDTIGLGETVSKMEDPSAIHFRSTVERLHKMAVTRWNFRSERT